MANSIRRAQKPLAGSTVSPTNLAYNGVNLTPPTIPQAPIVPGVNSQISQSLQNYQNAANAANQQRYAQGLGVMTAGDQASQQSIQNAMASNATYGQSAKTQLGLQLQQALGQQGQSAVSRGLSDTTIADTMKDLPTRQYNDAVNQVTEQQANRAAGLQLDLANAQSGQGNSIANYIASRNDQGPNVAQYASLAQGAAARPQGGHVSSGISGGSPSGPEFGLAGDLPNSAGAANRVGGGGSFSGGGPGGYFSMSGNSGGSTPTSPNQGYTGAASSAGGPASTPDSGPSGMMSNAGYAPGSISIKPTQSAAASSPTPISTAVQPTMQQTPNVGQNQSAPCPFYNAMQGLCSDGQNRTSNGGSGGIA